PSFLSRIAAVVSSYFLSTAPFSPVFVTLSLHDALPIYGRSRMPDVIPDEVQALEPAHRVPHHAPRVVVFRQVGDDPVGGPSGRRSEEHTSELQSPDIVCRLLLQ